MGCLQDNHTNPSPRAARPAARGAATRRPTGAVATASGAVPGNARHRTPVREARPPRRGAADLARDWMGLQSGHHSPCGAAILGRPAEVVRLVFARLPVPAARVARARATSAAGRGARAVAGRVKTSGLLRRPSCIPAACCCSGPPPPPIESATGLRSQCCSPRDGQNVGIIGK